MIVNIEKYTKPNGRVCYQTKMLTVDGHECKFSSVFQDNCTEKQLQGMVKLMIEMKHTLKECITPETGHVIEI